MRLLTTCLLGIRASLRQQMVFGHVPLFPCLPPPTLIWHSFCPPASLLSSRSFVLFEKNVFHSIASYFVLPLSPLCTDQNVECSPCCDMKLFRTVQNFSLQKSINSCRFIPCPFETIGLHVLSTAVVQTLNKYANNLVSKNSHTFCFFPSQGKLVLVEMPITLTLS